MIRILMAVLFFAAPAAAQELTVSTTPIMPAAPPPAYCPERAACGWERAFGGAGADKGYAIAALDGGDILIAGTTLSHGSTRDDGWVLRLNRAGRVLWEQRLGGPDTDRIYGIAPSGDGAILAGHTRSLGAGEADLWVVKIDGNGEVLWQSTLGGPENDRPRGVAPAPAPDGGALVVGHTRSFGAGDGDLWAVRVDAVGAVLWRRTIGTARDEGGFAVAPRPGGGFVLTGYAQHANAPGLDVYTIALDDTGETIWEDRIDRGWFDAGAAILPRAGGDSVIAGMTIEKTGERPDILAARLDGDGALLWERRFGGADGDTAWGLAPAPDDGVVVLGSTKNQGAGSVDLWLIGLDADGETLWERVHGGALWDRGMAAVVDAEGDLLIAGTTTSQGFGFEDIWALRLRADGRFPSY